MRFKLTKTSERYGMSAMMITVEPKTAEDIIGISERFGEPVIVWTKGEPEIEIYDDYRE